MHILFNLIMKIKLLIFYNLLLTLFIIFLIFKHKFGSFSIFILSTIISFIYIIIYLKKEDEIYYKIQNINIFKFIIILFNFTFLEFFLVITIICYTIIYYSPDYTFKSFYKTIGLFSLIIILISVNNLLLIYSLSKYRGIYK